MLFQHFENLLDFPGRRSLEYKLVSRPSVFKTVNKLRHKFGKPTLVLEDKKKILSPMNIIMSVLLVIYVGVAIVEQLRRPPGERTWHGRIAGIPYDFRMPTVDRLRATFWNKDTAQILVPQAFGIGWTVNLYPLLHPQPSQGVL